MPKTTRIYKITFTDGGWIKAELSVGIEKAYDQAIIQYGDDIKDMETLPETDAAVIKFNAQ